MLYYFLKGLTDISIFLVRSQYCTVAQDACAWWGARLHTSYTIYRDDIFGNFACPISSAIRCWIYSWWLGCGSFYCWCILPAVTWPTNTSHLLILWLVLFELSFCFSTSGGATNSTSKYILTSYRILNTKIIISWDLSREKTVAAQHRDRGIFCPSMYWIWWLHTVSWIFILRSFHCYSHSSALNMISYDAKWM